MYIYVVVDILIIIVIITIIIIITVNIIIAIYGYILKQFLNTDWVIIVNIEI